MSYREDYGNMTDDWRFLDHPDPRRHAFLSVAGHPDDDECTYREDGTDRTYCGSTLAEHSSDTEGETR